MQPLSRIKKSYIAALSANYHSVLDMLYRYSYFFAVLLLMSFVCWKQVDALDDANLSEEDLGEGLRVLTTFKPADCKHRAKVSDVIHYHYVGRLGQDGRVFGKSFDYNSPYIVSLGQGRIIAGMDRGLIGMCLWERRRITIPSRLAYGDRGVGSVIPPNSTLVFYVRMIKIERNGHSLGEDQSIEGLWNSGVQSYSLQEWQQTVDMLEEALKLFHQYENTTYICLKSCEAGAPLQLTDVQRSAVLLGTGEDSTVFQFLGYADKSKCIEQCKITNLPQKLRNPDVEVLTKFRQHEPYSYLHFAYYKLGNIEEGAKSLFTYCFSHSGDMCSEGLHFYRSQLQLKANEVVFRIPGKLPHHILYLEGKQAYENKDWKRSADLFEEALTLYDEGLNHCQLMCEDLLHVNLSEGISLQKMKKFTEQGLTVDSMEYYALLRAIIRRMLECKVNCHDKMATIEGTLIDNYLPNHFHYLQYDYFKMEMLQNAAKAASTYLALDPSSVVMNSNIRLYTSKFNIPAEDSMPRDEIVAKNSRLLAMKELLHFAETGKLKKKAGLMGDPDGQSFRRHGEL